VAGVSGVNGQTRATAADLVGTVRDQTGAVLPGVVVTATNIATNVPRSTTTQGDGRFALQALPPGVYRLEAVLSGFVTESRGELTLRLGELVELDFALRLAGTVESVNVVADAPVVDVQKTAVASVVSQQQIESLPIDGRNFISFAIITPGVTTDRTPQQGASATSGLTFAGQRARSNNITVDGLNNNDAVVGSVRATFSQEAVREFQVLTNSYSAEFGNATGGVLNIVTKSGANEYAGNAFVFVRDDGLNAKGHFEKFDPFGNAVTLDKAPFSQEQFGATLGGPIRRDRSFFFVSLERLDVAASNLVTIDDRTVIAHPFTGAPLGTPAQILRGAGFPVETGNVGYGVNSTQLLAKVDHQLAPNHALAMRFNTSDALNENIEPFGGITARSRAAALEADDIVFTTGLTSIFSSRWVNEVRFQYAYRDQLVRSLDPNCGGPCLQSDQGGPTLEVTGVASVGRQRFTPNFRTNGLFQVVDTASFAMGTHLFKGGIDLNLTKDSTDGPALPLHFGGRYIFQQLPAIPGLLPAPVSPIQAVALGLPAAYVQGYGRDSDQYDTSSVALFFQDDWRIGARATLKYGVRYQNQFWPDTSYGAPGYPGTFSFPSDGNNIAPRVAVSWDATGDRKTSVHAAYGLFFENHITGLVGITDLLDGDDHVRTLVRTFPASLPAWQAPGHRLPESAVGSFTTLKFLIDPGLQSPYAHHAAIGVDRELPGNVAVSANVVYARGLNQIGTIDYNPVVPSLGPGRRPQDIGGVAGTSASLLQYTSFGETWYKGLTLSLNKRYSQRHQFLVSYTLAKAEDNSTDFQSAFIPQQNGRGRDPGNVDGLPVGFDPDSERGPSTQDQRHRLVASGVYTAPGSVQLAAIVTAASGRPYTILAGADLNGDGNGGAFPPDRARADITSEASSVGRNSGTMPKQVSVDLRVSRRFRLGQRAYLEGMLETFNLFNRTNFIETNNLSSAFIFGSGGYPTNPLPGFGHFTQAGPPRQVQLALKVGF
jgi:Carboxypeptidase regulatory-like domain/TonB dependent receptor/TonB-dependent Receptor Plug Domain